ELAAGAGRPVFHDVEALLAEARSAQWNLAEAAAESRRLKKQVSVQGPEAVTDEGRGKFAPQSTRRCGGWGMELKIMGLNFTYAVMGAVLMFNAFRVIDWLTPEVHFPDELKKGNIAVSIFIAAIFVSIALIIGGALK